MHGAAKLSKKQLQRLKVQAQESKELAELQGIVGMHNVPLIMQTYWEVKGRPNGADGELKPRGCQSLVGVWAEICVCVFVAGLGRSLCSRHAGR